MVVLHKVSSEQDLEKCLYVRREVFMKEQNVDISEEIDSFDIIDDTKVIHFYITNNNNNLVGCSRILITSDYIKIGRVAILKEFRKKGYALDMLSQVENYFGSNNYVLEAQLYVTSLYEKAGYTSEGDIFLDANIEHVKMTKHV